MPLPAGPALLCFPREVQGLLTQVLQPVRNRALPLSRPQGQLSQLLQLARDKASPLHPHQVKAAPPTLLSWGWLTYHCQLCCAVQAGIWACPLKCYLEPCGLSMLGQWEVALLGGLVGGSLCWWALKAPSAQTPPVWKRDQFLVDIVFRLSVQRQPVLSHNVRWSFGSCVSVYRQGSLSDLIQKRCELD